MCLYMYVYMYISNTCIGIHCYFVDISDEIAELRDAKAAASPDLTQIEEGADEPEVDGQKFDIDLGQIEQKFAAQKAQLERNDSVGQ